MAMATATIGDLTPEQFYATVQHITQREKLIKQEAGKAVVAVGSRWIKTSRNQVPSMVRELPQFNQQTYEDMYIHVDLLHRAVNKVAESITENFAGFSPPTHLLEEEEVGDDLSGKLKSHLKFTRQWARWIQFGSRMEDLLKPALWCGNGYWEIVRDTESAWKITYLKEINPKEMRVVRSATGDDLGYVQFPFKGGLGVLSESMRDKYKTMGAVFFEKDAILHLKWDALPSDPYGQSIFESIKDIMAIIIGLREDMGIIGKNNATPSTHYRMGTDIIPASPKSITDFSTTLEGMDHTQDLVTSTFIDSQPIRDPSKILDMPGYLRSALNILFAALGLAEILFGQGNETTEATARSQIEAAAQMFRSIQRRLKDQIELRILPLLLENKGYENLLPDDMDSIPEISFHPIETEEDKRLRLERGVELGSLSHQDYRKAYGYRPKIKGDVRIQEDREFQLELAKASKPPAFTGQGAGGGPGKSTKKDRSDPSQKKKGLVKNSIVTFVDP